MKTSPAFQFYPADFLSGTAFFSCEEKGAYLVLLCHQWQQGFLPNDDALLAKLCGCEITTIQTVKTKFSAGKDGRLRNKRLEAVRKDLEAFRLSRKLNGSKGGRPRKLDKTTRLSVAEPTGKLSVSSQSQSLIYKRPCIEEAKAAGSLIGVTEIEAEEWWHAREANEWMKGMAGGGTTPVGRNWQSDLKIFTNNARNRTAEQKTNGNHKHSSKPDYTGTSTAGDNLKRL